MDKRIAAAILAVLALALLLAGILLLPETVVVQVGAGGQPSNTLPRLAAVLLPFVITVCGSFAYLKTSFQPVKCLVAAIAGVAAAVLTLIFNLIL